MRACSQYGGRQVARAARCPRALSDPGRAGQRADQGVVAGHAGEPVGAGRGGSEPGALGAGHVAALSADRHPDPEDAAVQGSGQAWLRRRKGHLHRHQGPGGQHRPDRRPRRRSATAPSGAERHARLACGGHGRPRRLHRLRTGPRDHAGAKRAAGAGGAAGQGRSAPAADAADRHAEDQGRRHPPGLQGRQREGRACAVQFHGGEARHRGRAYPADAAAPRHRQRRDRRQFRPRSGRRRRWPPTST